jgi:hypothetical protein
MVPDAIPETALQWQGSALVSAPGDAARQAWDDWRRRAEIQRPGLGFYSLRRFFGDYATRKGGDAAGDTALAHTAKSVRGKHYSNYRDFDRIQEIGRELHRELTAAGMFEPVERNPRDATDREAGSQH